MAGSSGAIFIAESAPQTRRPVAASSGVAGLPSCAAALAAQAGLHVLGDSAGQLYCLDFRQQGQEGQGQPRLMPIQASGPVAAPSCMAFLSGWTDAAGSAAGALEPGVFAWRHVDACVHG